MSSKKTAIVLAFLAALAVIGKESAISVNPGCVIRVEEIPFRLYHWGRGWKNGTVQNSGNVTFPGEGGTQRNGTFRVHGGSFSYKESVKLPAENEAELKLELSNADGIDRGTAVRSIETTSHSAEREKSSVRRNMGHLQCPAPDLGEKQGKYRRSPPEWRSSEYFRNFLRATAGQPEIQAPILRTPAAVLRRFRQSETGRPCMQNELPPL